jgi:N utilization substance protein B
VYILYQQDLLRLESEEALGRIRDEYISEYVTRIVRGVGSERPTIDGLLDRHLSGWSLERLGVLERSILRVAVYELVKEAEVPVAVVVDEAVNLAKRFCSVEAGALVNGILGNVARVCRPAEPHADGQAEGVE